MANQVFANNASAVLASSITDTDTTATVASGQGALFPTISGGNWAKLTLVDTSGNLEVVKCTAHTLASDSFTIERHQESTTARAFSAGDLLELRVTQGTLEELRDAAHQTSGTIDGVVIGGTTPAAATVTTLTATGNATIGDGTGDAHTIKGTTSFGTTAWPTTFLGKSGHRVLIGDEGQLALWNETAGAGNAATLYLGAKHASVATAMGAIRLQGGTEGSDYASFATLATMNGAGTMTERMRIDSAGNVGIGATPSAWSGGASKALQVGQFGIKQTDGTNATAMATNAYYNGTNWIYAGSYTATMYEQYGWTHRWSAAISGTAGNTITWAVMGYTHSTDTTSGFNAAAAALKLYKDTATSRSINAAGTINASGADYAEYERKRAGCGLIAKGQIVGRTADGLLTDRWSEAITYGVKTTNPSLVGGDTWGTEEAIGMTMPEPPRLPEIVHADEPGDRESVAWAEWDAARQDAEASAAQAYALAKIEYDGQMVVFEQRLEAARADVDRIAYAGRVPCNVTGAAPGDYIVAAEGADDSIIGQAIAPAAIDFANYRRAVGRVHRILDDGRAEIAVMVH